MKKIRESNAMRELDELVAAELDEIQKLASPEPQALAKEKGEWPAPEDSRGRVTPFKSRPSPLYPPEIETQPLARDLDAEHLEIEGMGRLKAVRDGTSGADFPNQEPQEPDRLLAEEEERFIANIVGWLGPRAHKDVIIARIWTKLTESEPESFYSLGAGEISAAAESSEQDVGLPEDE